MSESEDLVQVATEFVYQLLRTSPGHLDTPVGKRLLDKLGFTRSEGVTDAIAYEPEKWLRKGKP